MLEDVKSVWKVRLKWFWSGLSSHESLVLKIDNTDYCLKAQASSSVSPAHAFKVKSCTYVSDSNRLSQSSDCPSPNPPDISSLRSVHTCSDQSYHVLACRWCHSLCHSKSCHTRVCIHTPVCHHLHTPSQNQSQDSWTWWFCEEAGSDWYL